VHFLVDDAKGMNNCFLCDTRARYMIPANKDDFPVGCTIQPINCDAYEWRPQE
jgi:hypothetical protein